MRNYHRTPPSTLAIALAGWLLLVPAARAQEPSAQEEAPEPPSTLDRIWDLPVLYSNDEAAAIQKLVLRGRIQPDSVWVDGEGGPQEEFSDILWRRFRFGFKMTFLHDWDVHVEGDFDLNESLGDSYARLTDANIGWQPREDLNLKILKHSAPFTLDGKTSSTKLLTPERNNLTNNLWFTAEYFTGLSAGGTFDPDWSYKLGLYSSDPSPEISEFEAGYFLLASLGHDFAEPLGIDRASVSVAYVDNEEDENAGTRDFGQVLSLVTEWENGRWGLWTDLSIGEGYFDQPDVWGAVLMPFVDLGRKVQLVLRSTYVTSDEVNGVRLRRYEDRVEDGRCDEYLETYAGLNVFFYDHRLKWQTGVAWVSADDRATDGGGFEGWDAISALRISW